MPRIALVVHGLRGSLANSMALARGLVRRDHEVTVLAYRNIGAHVAPTGAGFIRLIDGPDAADRIQSIRSDEGVAAALRAGRRERKRLLGLDEVTDRLRDLDPDLAVIDMEMHGAVLAATQLQLPLVLAVPWHDVGYARRRPPMHTELGAAVDPWAQARISAAWLSLWARRHGRRLLGPLHPTAALARFMPQQLNSPDRATIVAAARRVGVNLGAITRSTDWMHPFVYTHAPAISYTLRELELDAASPPSVRHVGPMIDPERYQAPLSAADGDALDAVLASTHRVVYCSMGSLQAANRDYYQTVIDAFAARSGWRLVLGLGSRGTETDLRVDTHRTLVLDDAPQLRILGRADLAIHPAGTGTFYECVRSRVPSIVMHTGHVDMPGVAARVEHFGLGVVRAVDGVTSEELFTEARRLVQSPPRVELERYAQAIERHEREATAIALLEEMMQLR